MNVILSYLKRAFRVEHAVWTLVKSWVGGICTYIHTQRERERENRQTHKDREGEGEGEGEGEDEEWLKSPTRTPALILQLTHSVDTRQTHLSVVHKLQVSLYNSHVAWQSEHPVGGYPVLEHEEVNARVGQLV